MNYYIYISPGYIKYFYSYEEALKFVEYSGYSDLEIKEC